MAKLVKLFLFLLCLFFDYQGATCLSPSPSPPSLSSSDDANKDDNHLLCSHGEKTALLQFRRLFGENPPTLITWKAEASSDCCSWYGVVCDELTGHVIGLDLSDSKLHGAIPSNSTLFHISHLQGLYLSHNDFNGSSISPAFGLNFPHLTSLDLSSSNFAGSVNWLTNLAELEWLDLSSNKLTGPIPTKISGLEKLTMLDLRNNSLSGTLPPNLFGSPILSYMDLSFNRLCGAIPTTTYRVQNTSSLRDVRLNDNNIQGSLLGSIARLSSLNNPQLSNNNLSGTLTPEKSKRVIKQLEATKRKA